jgi:hypothetical protein
VRRDGRWAWWRPGCTRRPIPSPRPDRDRASPPPGPRSGRPRPGYAPAGAPVDPPAPRTAPSRRRRAARGGSPKRPFGAALEVEQAGPRAVDVAQRRLLVQAVQLQQRGGVGVVGRPRTRVWASAKRSASVMGRV